MFPGGHTDAVDLGIGFEESGYAVADVGNRLLVPAVVRNAVFIFSAEGVDVPMEDVDLDAMIFGIIEDLLPERDLVVQGNLLHDLGIGWIEDVQLIPVAVAFLINGLFQNMHIVVVRLGILGQLDDARIGMGCPECQDVIAVADHGIEELLPELPLPHYGDVLMG